MYPWLEYKYNKKKKKRSKLNSFTFLCAFILIAIGLSLTLCADMLDTSEDSSLISDELSDAEAADSAPPADEIDESSVPDEIGALPASDPPPIPDAPEDGAKPEDHEGPAHEEIADAQASGPENISAVVAAPASSAEKIPDETSASVGSSTPIDVSETDDYFSDALFIGDSRTQGLLLYSNLGNASYYAARGLTVEQVFKKAVVDSGGGKLTVSDALSRRAFGKVYLMFGLNELGWNSADKFIEQYGRVLDRVRETQPDAIVYVQGIMPVSAWKSEKDPVHNNPNIARFNEMIERLTEEKNAIYLKVSDGVADESGVLPDEASSDGIHLNKKYCIKWEEYLRAHEM
jgi:lysophospholipase L1-like esterase